MLTGAAATVLVGGDPGVDLLVGGAVMIAAGVGLWLRFVRSIPQHHA